MSGAAPHIPSRLTRELRAYAIAAFYLWVCFSALLLFKAALLREHGVTYFHVGLALGKALILGKFLLIGEAVRVGARGEAKTRLARIGRRVVMLLALLALLSLVEELAVGLLHGRAAADVLGEFGGDSALELAATCLLVGLVLVPYVATQELGHALGPGELRRVLLERPEGTAARGDERTG